MSEIHEALEACAIRRSSSFCDPPATASKRDVLLLRRTLLRFLDEIDGDMSVSEVRAELEEYEHD